MKKKETLWCNRLIILAMHTILSQHTKNKETVIVERTKQDNKTQLYEHSASA